jgi:hypothetical protein
MSKSKKFRNNFKSPEDYSRKENLKKLHRIDGPGFQKISQELIEGRNSQD